MAASLLLASVLAAPQQWPGSSLVFQAQLVEERDRWESPDGKHWWDEEAAARACDFFPTFLEHHKGAYAGQPFELLPWQRDLIIAPLFGWMRASDDSRRFRKLYCAVPKKNGKSQIGAGIGLLLLTADGEEGAEIYSAAGDKEQAKVIFATAKVMVETSPYLSRRARAFRDAIVVEDTHSSYQVLSAEAYTKHGFNIHGLIFDELHTQPDRDLHETLTHGVISRRQPLIAEFTTAGDDPESICREEQDYAEGVLQGHIDDPEFLPVIFEAKQDDDWKDPAVWAKANPSLGISIPYSALEAECRQASNEPRKQAGFKRLHLNIWTQQSRIWIPLEDWDACKGERPAFERGYMAVAGIDLSSAIDLTSIVVLVRRPAPQLVAAPAEDVPELEVAARDADGNELQDDEGKPVRRTLRLDYHVDVIPFFWIPEDTMHQRAKEDRIPYPLWVEQGLIRATPGSVVDQDLILDQVINDIAPKYGIKSFGYDPYNANPFAVQLAAAGYEAVQVGQDFKRISEPSKLFEALIRSKRLHHDGHKALRWCVGNVAVKEDNNENIRPVKPHKGSKQRIDGVVATIIGLRRLMDQPVPTGSSYDERAERGEEPMRWA